MQQPTKLLFLVGLCAATVLGGCTPASGPNPAASVDAAGQIPSDWPKLPDGATCTGDLVRFQTILKSDVEKGYINRPVYDEVAPELRTAAEACAAGRDAEARKLVQASKKRYGYRS
jgi:hypothetical protein